MTKVNKSNESSTLVGKLLALAHDILHLAPAEDPATQVATPAGLDSIMMSDNTPVEKVITSVILKSDEERRLVTGVVMVPDEEDTHGDSFDAPQIEEAAYEFMASYQTIGLQHAGDTYEVRIVESYIAREESVIGDQEIKKGSWVMTVKINSDALWGAVKSGTFTGFSIGGFAERV